jgi:AraC-like DNA-binding protein
MTSPTNSQLIEADDRLATVFSHFYCVQHDRQAAPVQQQLMPNYEMLLVFNFGPAIMGSFGDSEHIIEQTAVIGPLQKTLTYTVPPGADFIVVNFTLNGFYRLLGVSMQQLNPASVHDPDVLLNKSCFSELWTQMVHLASLKERLKLICDYARKFVTPLDSPSVALLDSVPYFRHLAVDPVKMLAQTHHVSTRSVQLHFQTYLGYSAKELGRFLRFKKILNFLYRQPTQPVDWPELVLTFGYYDHSHLSKDFRYFLGTTPRQFVKQLAQGQVCISKSGKFY